MSEQSKTIGFATAVCLICSLTLAFVDSALKERQEKNAEVDVKSKVLKVFGEVIVDDSGKSLPAETILDNYKHRVSGVVLDRNGLINESIDINSLDSNQINDRGQDGLKFAYPVYKYTNPETGAVSYAIHISGMGLWSVVKGYMALAKDLKTITGVVFYEHQETPGLGGEVDKDYFQDRFKGKTLLTGNTIVPFQIVKPGAPLTDHSIDGISGATMTCNGVTAFINSDFAVYNKYLSTLRK